MKKLLAILIAGVFASSAFAVDASAPVDASAHAAGKGSASSGKHKKHNKKHHKSHKAAASAAN